MAGLGAAPHRNRNRGREVAGPGKPGWSHPPSRSGKQFWGTFLHPAAGGVSGEAPPISDAWAALGCLAKSRLTPPRRRC